MTTGWHAIEFLLWGQDRQAHAPGSRPFTDYVPDGGTNDRRRTYLELVADQLAADLHSLAAEWSADNPAGYRAAFLGLPPREALGRIFNGMAILAGFEMMSERLAVALDSGDQEDEHSCFSDNTHADFQGDIAGIRNVWFGTVGEHAGPGLDGLVRGLDAALANRVVVALNQAEAAITAIDRPFDRMLAAPSKSRSRQEAEAAVAALGRLGDVLKEVGRTLGILVLLPS